jgi:hypothetical protein
MREMIVKERNGRDRKFLNITATPFVQDVE